MNISIPMTKQMKKAYGKHLAFNIACGRKLVKLLKETYG